MVQRTLIVGDVHGCAYELDQLLRIAEPDRLILAGDLFTRGPDPLGVWSLISSWQAEAVMGNHDVMVLSQWTPHQVLPPSAFRWLQERPHALHGKRWSVVHAGVHPHNGAKKTSPRRAIFKTLFKGRPWWRQYRGRRLIIHGHDAARGLNDQRPYTLGLDTRCVRGGALSGYLLEEDRILSVRSRRDYVG